MTSQYFSVKNGDIYLLTPLYNVKDNWLEFMMLHYLDHVRIDNIDSFSRPFVRQVRVDESNFHAINGSDFYADLVMEDDTVKTMNVLYAIQRYPSAIYEYIKYVHTRQKI